MQHWEVRQKEFDSATGEIRWSTTFKENIPSQSRGTAKDFHDILQPQAMDPLHSVPCTSAMPVCSSSIDRVVVFQSPMSVKRTNTWLHQLCPNQPPPTCHASHTSKASSTSILSCMCVGACRRGNAGGIAQGQPNDQMLRTKQLSRRSVFWMSHDTGRECARTSAPWDAVRTVRAGQLIGGYYALYAPTTKQCIALRTQQHKADSCKDVM